MKLSIVVLLGVLATTANAGNRHSGYKKIRDAAPAGVSIPYNTDTRLAHLSSPPAREASADRTAAAIRDHVVKQMYLFRDKDTACKRKWGYVCFPILSDVGCNGDNWKHTSVEVFPSIEGQHVTATAEDGKRTATGPKCASLDAYLISEAHSSVPSTSRDTDLDPAAMESRVPLDQIYKLSAGSSKNRPYGTIVGDIAYAVTPRTLGWTQVDRLVKVGRKDEEIQQEILRMWDVRLIDYQKKSPIPHPATKFLPPLTQRLPAESKDDPFSDAHAVDEPSGKSAKGAQPGSEATFSDTYVRGKKQPQSKSKSKSKSTDTLA